MTVTDLLAAALAGNLDFVKATVGDLSDADLLTRPAPAANHGNWQLGHLVVAETRMLTAGGAAMPELPAGFADRYTKHTAGTDDAAAFATKAELLAHAEGLVGHARAIGARLHSSSRARRFRA